MVKYCITCLHCMPNGPFPPMGSHCRINHNKIPFGSEELCKERTCKEYISRLANRDILEWRHFNNVFERAPMRSMPPPAAVIHPQPILVPRGAVLLPNERPPAGPMVNRSVQGPPMPPF